MAKSTLRTFLRAMAHIETVPIAASKTVEYPDRYLAVAGNYGVFHTWVVQYGVARSSITLIGPHNANGWIDYSLIVMHGYEKVDPGLFSHLRDRADHVFYTRHSYPVTHEGRIVEWRNFNG